MITLKITEKGMEVIRFIPFITLKIIEKEEKTNGR